MGDTTARTAAGTLLLVVLVLVSYGPAHRAGFIIDDDNYVTENPTLRDMAGLGRIWFEIGATPQYYPLVYTTFWVEFQSWGDKPTGYHVNNILLHAINAILLWILLRRLSLPGAWFAAAIFAVHPVHVESVAWIAERKNVLSGVFYFLAALVYLRFTGLDNGRANARSRWVCYAAALILFLAALLSKTATLSLPAAILLVIWWKRGRIDLRRDLVALVPMFAMAIGLALVTLRIETTTGGATGALWELSWIERILVAGRALWFYAAKLLWPAALSFNYPRWSIDAGLWWQYVFPVAAVAVVAWLWTARNRFGRGPLVGVLYFAGTLAPTLGFFKVYFFRYSYVADHFQYLASIGVIAIVVGVAARWLARQSRPLARAGAAIGIAVLVTLSGLTILQARSYRTLEALCLDVLEKNPASWLANNNLGNLHLQRGELEEAVRRFDVALRSAPDYLETHLNLAIAYMNLGRFDNAERHARRAIEIRPGNVLGYQSLGDVLLRDGRPEAAVPWYLKTLKMDPGLLKAELNLANALARSGRMTEAVPRFESVLHAEPENITALTNLAIVLVQLGRPHEAIVHLETARRLDPENPAIRKNLDLARSRM